MPAPIRRCPDHGYHEGDCPLCGADGEHVMIPKVVDVSPVDRTQSCGRSDKELQLYV